MKKLKQILAIVLVAAMCFVLLAACASNAKPEDTPEQEENNPPAQNEESQAEPEEGETEQEIVDISMYVFDIAGNASRDYESVVEAMNEITEAAIGVHISLTYIGMADYATQVTLAVTGGEDVDLINIIPVQACSLATLYSNGELMELSDYINEETAPELMGLVGDYLDAYTINGGLYGVPTYRIYNTDRWIIMRTDILDEMGLTEQAKAMTSWADYDAILEKVAEAYAGTGMYAISKASGYTVLFDQAFMFGGALTGASFEENVAFDNLGDGQQVIFSDDEGHAYFYGEQQGWIDANKKVAQWFNDGWLYPDSYLSDDHCDVLMKQGVTFSDVQGSEVGIEVAKKSATGYDVTCLNICPGMVTTTTLASWGAALPITCDEPEACIKFLELLYTSPELMNLYDYGIEGRDYVVVDGEACYPEGIDATTCYHGSDWMLGNQFIIWPWDGQGANFREEALANNAKVLSRYLGFTFDNSELSDTIAALTSVGNEYNRQLYCGLYTDELYESYLSAMKAAGIDDYVAEYQRQLDAWLAAK